eukprot:462025_1
MASLFSLTKKRIKNKTKIKLATKYIFEAIKKRGITKFKSAPAEKDASNSSKNTTKEWTISFAYSSKNEGKPWFKSPRKKKKIVVDLKQHPIIQPNEVDKATENKYDEHLEYTERLQEFIRSTKAYINAVCTDKHNITHFLETTSMIKILNNYIYLLHHNSDKRHMEMFTNAFSICDIDCKIFHRYCTQSVIDTVHNRDIAYSQILDTIHCYCQHNYIQSLSHKDKMHKLLKDDSNNHKNFNNLNFNNLNFRLNTRYNQLGLSSANCYCFGCEFSYEGDTGEYQGEEERYDLIFVSPKYLSLKEELLSKKHNIQNACLSSSQFDSEYSKTLLFFNCYFKKQYYPTMSRHHVLSLIIYCNYDKLQNELSKTYRDACGSKHNNFYHWGKLLKEAVHDFGTRMCDGKMQHLYHGISQKLQMNIRGTGVQIYCPLSTTSSIVVAYQFATMNGVTVEFSNSVISKAKYFEVSWLSNYGNEAEHLFIQSEHKILISNIIEPKENVEYVNIIKALTVIDQIVCEKHSVMTIPSFMKEIIIKILHHQLVINHNAMDQYKNFHSLTKYGKDMIDVFFKSKTSLNMNCHKIQKQYNFVADLLLNDSCHWVKFNLLHTLFPHVQSIEIEDVNLDLTMSSILQHLQYGLSQLKYKITKITIIANKDSKIKPAVLYYNIHLLKYGYIATRVGNVMSIELEPFGGDENEIGDPTVDCNKTIKQCPHFQRLYKIQKIMFASADSENNICNIQMELLEYYATHCNDNFLHVIEFHPDRDQIQHNCPMSKYACQLMSKHYYGARKTNIFISGNGFDNYNQNEQWIHQQKLFEDIVSQHEQMYHNKKSLSQLQFSIRNSRYMHQNLKNEIQHSMKLENVEHDNNTHQRCYTIYKEGILIGYESKCRSTNLKCEWVDNFNISIQTWKQKTIRAQSLQRNKFVKKQFISISGDYISTAAVMIIYEYTANNIFQQLICKEAREGVKKLYLFGHTLKILRKTVELFGKNMRNDTDYTVLYRGVDQQYWFNSAAVHCYIPTSTTTSLLVASTFAGSTDGCVLELHQHAQLDSCYLPLRYLSRYPLEKEYLFYGKYSHLYLKSVTDIYSFVAIAFFEELINDVDDIEMYEQRIQGKIPKPTKRKMLAMKEYDVNNVDIGQFLDQYIERYLKKNLDDSHYQMVQFHRIMSSKKIIFLRSETLIQHINQAFGFDDDTVRIDKILKIFTNLEELVLDFDVDPLDIANYCQDDVHSDAKCQLYKITLNREITNQLDYLHFGCEWEIFSELGKVTWRKAIDDGFISDDSSNAEH